MKFTAAERATLRLALYVAIEWESSLASAHNPDYGKPIGDALKTIRTCERNIKKFKRLRERLLEKASKTIRSPVIL